jgi:DNA repair protein RecO (recombination protein O)
VQWTDEGVVVGVKRHGEGNAILELMTRAHGRHLGLVRGGAGSRLRAVLQPGNSVRAVWRARLDEHLGNYSVEGIELRAASFLTAAHAVYGVTHLAALCRLLPERDPHNAVHGELEAILDEIHDPVGTATRIVHFELQMLVELGFGLDLARCAVTGVQSDLAFVSPKSGRAVSREAGEPWRDKLLPLPAFLVSDGAVATPSLDDLAQGVVMTGFFLARRVFEPRGLALPEARTSFFNAVLHGGRNARVAS